MALNLKCVSYIIHSWVVHKHFYIHFIRIKSLYIVGSIHQYLTAVLHTYLFYMWHFFPSIEIYRIFLSHPPGHRQIFLPHFHINILDLSSVLLALQRQLKFSSLCTYVCFHLSLVPVPSGRTQIKLENYTRFLCISPQSMVSSSSLRILLFYSNFSMFWTRQVFFCTEMTESGELTSPASHLGLIHSFTAFILSLSILYYCLTSIYL